MQPFWPSDTQETLLTAALGTAPLALAAWQNCAGKIDFTTLEPGASRLLPLVYAHLSRLGVDEAALAPLKNVQRRTWVKHQMLLRAFTPVQAALTAAGIDIILLKGLPLAFQYYPHVSTRPLSDIDLMVRLRDWSRTLKLLMDAGWTTEYALFDDPVAAGAHGLCFRNDQGIELDLHYSPFPECLRPDTVETLWTCSVPLTIGELSARSLCAPDQLLHVLAHGLRLNDVSPVRWVADAVLVIRHEPDFDWQRLLQRAGQFRLTGPVQAGLLYLEKRFPGLLPAEMPAALTARIGLLERLEWFGRKSPGFTIPMSRLGIFVRMNQGASLASTMARTLPFLRGVLKARSALSIASILTFKSIRAAWRLFRSRLRA